MSAHALTLLARDLDAQPSGMTPAACAELANQLRAYACAWQRESLALDEVVENAREEATQAEAKARAPMVSLPVLRLVRCGETLQ